MWKILESNIRNFEIIKNFRKYLPKITSSIQEVLNEPIIFLFGSALEGNTVAASDIDILIVSDVPKRQMRRAEIIVNIEETAELALDHPFEFHLLTPEEFKTWNEIYKLKLERIN